MSLNYQYSLIKFTPTKRYASIVDPKGTPRFVCFPEEVVARRCIRQMCEHRSEYGSWPSVDFTQQIATIKSKSPPRKRKLEELEKWFIIENMTQEEFSNFATGSGAQFFYCHEFHLLPTTNNTVNVSLRGQEIVVEENIELYRNRLSLLNDFIDDE
jgi:hypothetical protein